MSIDLVSLEKSLSEALAPHAAEADPAQAARIQDIVRGTLPVAEALAKLLAAPPGFVPPRAGTPHGVAESVAGVLLDALMPLATRTGVPGLLIKVVSTVAQDVFEMLSAVPVEDDQDGPVVHDEGP